MSNQISKIVFQDFSMYQKDDSEKEEAEKLLVYIQNFKSVLKELHNEKVGDASYQKALAKTVIQLENFYQSNLVLGSIGKYQLEELFAPIKTIVMNGMIDSKSENFLGVCKNAYYFDQYSGLKYWLQNFVSSDQGLYRMFLNALNQGSSNLQEFINS